MKQVKMAAIAISITTAMLSCKKDTQAPAPVAPPVATPTAVGLWVCKYGNGATLGIDYAQLIRTNGTMRSDYTATASSKVEGTWTINGLVIKTACKLKASVSPATEVLADQSFSSMEGSWKTNSAIGAGGFKMSKAK